MTSQYGAYVLRAGLARLYARMRMHTPTRLGTHMHACTHKHAHTPICNTYCFSTATMVSWKRLDVTLYVHCLSCFQWIYWSLVSNQIIKHNLSHHSSLLNATIKDVFGRLEEKLGAVKETRRDFHSIITLCWTVRWMYISHTWCFEA
jgi:hypothetical protein